MREAAPPDAVCQSEIAGLAPDHMLGRHAEEPLTAAVDESYVARLVESEHRDIDPRHHLAEQRGSFDGTATLLAQDLTELIQLAHCQA